MERKDFNSYGSRRGNHEVMIRGTFANIRLRNLLLDGVEGGFTRNFLAGGEQTTIYDAAQAYAAAGRARWSSWPARSTARARAATGRPRAPRCSASGRSIAESYERIHRSNLIGMGVLPLQFPAGAVRGGAGADGTETFDGHRGRRSSTQGTTPRTVRGHGRRQADGTVR